MISLVVVAIVVAVADGLRLGARQTVGSMMMNAKKKVRCCLHRPLYLHQIVVSALPHHHSLQPLLPQRPQHVTDRRHWPGLCDARGNRRRCGLQGHVRGKKRYSASPFVGRRVPCAGSFILFRWSLFILVPFLTSGCGHCGRGGAQSRLSLVAEQSGTAPLLPSQLPPTYKSVYFKSRHCTINSLTLCAPAHAHVPTQTPTPLRERLRAPPPPPQGRRCCC